MLLIYALIAAAPVLLIIGILFVIKGARNSTDENAIPITDIKEIREIEKNSYSEDDVKVKNTISELIVQQNVAGKEIKKNEDLFKEAEVLKEIEKLRIENSQLKEALEREVNNRNIDAYSNEFSKELSDTNKKLEDSLKSIKGLESEIERLKAQNADKDSRIKELIVISDESEKKFSDLISKNKELLDDISVLKEDKRLMMIEEANLRTSLINFEDLKNSNTVNEKLLSQKDELIINLNNKVSKLSEDFSAQIVLLRKENDQLRENIRQIEVSAKVEAVSSGNESMQEIDFLRTENEQFIKENINLKNEIDKINNINSKLTEQEKFLQYELAKNRAQSVGVEKICKRLKSQIEELNVSSKVSL